MDKRQITIPCSGYTIAADFYEGKDISEILLVFVGFGSSKARNAEFVTSIILRTQMSALVVDYSGHGESPFELDETRPAQHLLETTYVFDWLLANYSKARINVMGTSYGGFMAAYLTRFKPVQKLILRTPAIYKPTDFYTVHAAIDKVAVRDYRADSEAVSRHPLFLQPSIHNGPTLLVVHGKDESIPTETTNVYRQVFSTDTYTAADFNHAFSDPANPREQFAPYAEALATWLIK